MAINQCSRFRKMTRTLMIGLVCFGVVAVAGMVFAPLVGVIEYGYERVNVSGYLTWGPVYGLLLLPVSWPLGIWVSKILYQNDVLL